MDETDKSRKTDDVSNEKSREPGRRFLRVLFWSLASVLFLVVCGIVYLGLTWRSIAKTGGYSEEWRDAVDGSELSDVEYGELPWQKMDVYVPSSLDPTKSRGAIIFIHGGAWIGGGRYELQGFAKRMAKRGYLAANMEYMLYSDKGFWKDYKSLYSIDKVLDDVELAIKKLVEVGAERGYKIEKVALSGHSAGGHVSMLYGYSYKTRGNGAPPAEIAFVAPRVGPSDFHARTWKADGNQKKLAVMAWFASFMSGVEMTPEQYARPDETTEKAIESISPVSMVAPGVPPTLAAYGANDSLVPAPHCQVLKHAFSAMKAKGVAEIAPGDATTPVFDLLVFPNSNHMLGRDPDYTLKWEGFFLKYASKYLSDSPREPSVAPNAETRKDASDSRSL